MANNFTSKYEDILNGSWRKKWEEYQKPTLPKHRIDNGPEIIRCTCGAGPFKQMKTWVNHTVKALAREVQNGKK